MRRVREFVTLCAAFLLLAGAPRPAGSQRARGPRIDGRTPLKALVAAFASNDWPAVSDAEQELQSRQAAALPALFELLEREDKAELTNTMDLIYPGAKKFYGHGSIIDYDIDWIGVRAGWALERLTFQHFGFSEGAIKESELLRATLGGKRDAPLSEVIGPPGNVESRRQARGEAVRRAKEWWRESGAKWNRFDGLLDALRSGGPPRQIAAIGWLRHGETKCDGLNGESYTKLVRPEIERLARAEDGSVRAQAELQLKDRRGCWLKRKSGVFDANC